MKLFHHLIALLFLVMLPVFIAGSITATGQPYHIEWVGQFNSTADLPQQPGVARRVLKFIFGAKNERLLRPVSLISDPQGSWWVVDQGIGQVIQVNRQAGRFSALPSHNGEGFPSLVGICRSTEKQILFTDSRLETVFVQNGGDGAVRVWNDSLRLSRPTAIACSPNGERIIIAETGKHRLVVLDKSGRIVAYWGKRGTASGEFNFPTYLCIDREGLVYVVDAMNFRVQIFSPQGSVISMFGDAGDASGFLASPKGIATDSYGHIYVVDARFHAVQIFDREGNLLDRFGRQGRGEGEFWLPAGIFIDEQDHIFVADSYNARIQEFVLVEGGVNND